MRRLGLIVLVLVLIVGCTSLAPVRQETFENGDGEEQAMQEEIPTSIIVSMKDKQFNQSVIKIKKGGTVIWRNEDVRPYFFVIYYKNLYPNGDVQIDKTATGGINAGEEYSYTFDNVGEYKILPIEHGKLRGIVQVVE